jgi:serine/threonine protein phosphatase PrpC
VTDPASTPAKRWQAQALSVRGASHVRSDIVNQDAGGAKAFDDGSGCVIVVADGHGDPLHARSDQGSKLAVELAIQILGDWMKRNAEAPAEQATREAALLPEQILTAWRGRVADALKARPPTREEAKRLSAVGPEAMRDGALLYGSTLLAAAVGPRFAVYLQIGDGDIVTVRGDETPGRPVSGRSDLPISQTDSLCQSDALKRFRQKVHFFSADQPPPDLIALATDGYANSFDNDAEFLVIGRDFKRYLEQSGMDWVFGHMHDWLTETSEHGSGDDITLALAWFGTPDLRPPPPSRRWPRPGRALSALAVLLLVVIAAGFGARKLFPPTPGTAIAKTLTAKAAVTAIAFSPSSDGILAAATEQGLELWDAQRKPLPAPAGSLAPATTLGFSPDGHFIAVAVENSITLLPVARAPGNGAPAEPPPSLPPQAARVTSLAFSADGMTIAFAAGNMGWLWKPGEGALHYLPAQLGRVTSIAMRGNGQLVTVSEDGTITVWNAERSAVRSIPAHPAIEAVAIARDGAKLAAAGQDRMVRIWNLTTWQPLDSFDCPAAPARAVAFSPDGTLIACAAGNQLTVHSPAQERPRTFNAHAGALTAIAFSRDGARIAAAAGKAIEFFDVSQSSPE